MRKMCQWRRDWPGKSDSEKLVSAERGVTPHSRDRDDYRPWMNEAETSFSDVVGHLGGRSEVDRDDFLARSAAADHMHAIGWQPGGTGHGSLKFQQEDARLQAQPWL